jgi:hypothetical protein
MLPSSVLIVDVATEVARCMCGIAVPKSDSGTFLTVYYQMQQELAVFSWVSAV